MKLTQCCQCRKNAAIEIYSLGRRGTFSACSRAYCKAHAPIPDHVPSDTSQVLVRIIGDMTGTPWDGAKV